MTRFHKRAISFTQLVSASALKQYKNNKDINKYLNYTMKFNIFLLIILFFASCSVHKQNSSFHQQTDSLRQTTHLYIQTAKIPESRANISIPTVELQRLPAGAAFIQKSGQATAEIRFLHDTLFVTATCDSLQNLVYQYEGMVERMSNQTTQTEKKKLQSYPYGNILIWLLFICAIFVAYKNNRI